LRNEGGTETRFADMKLRNISHLADPTEYTPHFSYAEVSSPDGARGARELYCDGVPVERIAKATGTPVYAYSQGSIEDSYKRLDRAFGKFPHAVCYALKANANLAILRLMMKLGSSFDIVSGGELDMLRRVGVNGGRIVFSGVGKTREEIRYAIRYPGEKTRQTGILMFNVESEAELGVLLEEAERHIKAGGKRVSAAIRVNPDIFAGGHPHIATGYHEHKFGMEWPQAIRLYLAHKDSRWIAWRGISTHIGSQIVELNPFRRACERVASYVRELGKKGIRLDHLDMGGGIGIRYTNEKKFDERAYARALEGVIRPLGCKLLIEPGRAIMGPAGVLLTRVLYVKRNGGKRFVIVDAAMNDLIRPSLYAAIHPITEAVRAQKDARKGERVDVVGPVCESGDFLARDWLLPEVKAGDLLVIWATGAYGYVLASNYNSRLKAPEVLVDGRKFRVIRQRQSFDDLARGEMA
jgi:diaminopimelate decarboxylase